MLNITIPAIELYDENKNEFITSKEISLQLEHSLVSISKWESKWKKSFISTNDKTDAEVLDYIKCMIINKNNYDIILYEYLPKNILDKISSYISDSMTATTFSKERLEGNKSREIITSELIYYWMIAYNIPIECQKWHINRLLTLIQICSIKNESPKKMNHKTLASRNRALNASRRQMLNTNG